MLGFRTPVPDPRWAACDPRPALRGANQAVPGSRTGAPGAARLIVLTLLVAACGATVRPSATHLPPPSSAPATPIPRIAPFAPAAYPAKDDAPFAQKVAPDEKHGPYRGELKRISAPEPDTVIFELCRADVAFLS